MNTYRIILVTMVALAISPLATARIYKCDGPDGPIYSDQDCGPGAANVELSNTAGLGGITDEDKAELARKKAARDEGRSSNSGGTAVNNQFNNANTEAAGRWARRPYKKPGRDVSRDPRPKPGRDVSRDPRPVTLPANAASVKRKR